LSRIAYVNGRYLPHAMAGVHVEDRGYQFADGVYEVIAVQNGRLVDEQDHLDRLGRSLAETRMAWPMAPRSMRMVMREVVRRNRIGERGIIYIQVTRGVAPRNHAFPRSTESTLVMTARRLPRLDRTALRAGVRVITTSDIRWSRRDIKSVSLLPNVLAKQKAVDHGAFEAWLVDDQDTVTEGTASNAWIVTAGGELATRHADSAILNGVTRRMVMEICSRHGITFLERAFSVEEAKGAREAFLTSTTALVKPVIQIDDVVIGEGRVGPITDTLLDFYLDHMLATPSREES
jgi:D-alanine transaminase